MRYGQPEEEVCPKKGVRDETEHAAQEHRTIRNRYQARLRPNEQREKAKRREGLPETPPTSLGSYTLAAVTATWRVQAEPIQRVGA